MKLVLGTMTFGESVFAPNVSDTKNSTPHTSTTRETVKSYWGRFCRNLVALIKSRLR